MISNKKHINQNNTASFYTYRKNSRDVSPPTVNGATVKTDILVWVEAMETGRTASGKKKKVGKPENIHTVGPRILSFNICKWMAVQQQKGFSSAEPQVSSHFHQPSLIIVPSASPVNFPFLWAMGIHSFSYSPQHSPHILSPQKAIIKNILIF